MKNMLKTEIIFEVASTIKQQNGYKNEQKVLKHNIQKSFIKIIDTKLAKKIGREVGSYVSYNFDELLYFDVAAKNFLCNQIKHTLSKLVEQKNITPNKILVVGLGNNLYACDRLGSIVAKNIFVTKPYLDKKLFSPGRVAEVYSVCTGVYGTTGLDSSDILRAICGHINPDIVIVVDSMLSQDENRLALSVQISDTKLLPGGGVGNARKEISEQSIGVPIIALGVPFVLSTKTLCKNAANLIVCPKDVEQKVLVMGKTIAKAINLAFSNLSQTQLLQFMD